MLDFRIETFLAACRHMNFTAAAEELLTLPSRQYAAYPVPGKEIRRRAVVRDGKRLELTRAGEILKRTMITMENDQRAMEKRMRESGNAVEDADHGRDHDHWGICGHRASGPVSEPPSGRECMPAVQQHGPAFQRRSG